MDEVAFLEPWSLGDAIIAASVSRCMNIPVSLFINSKFTLLIQRLLIDYSHVKVVALDLDYTERGHGRLFLSDLKKIQRQAEHFSAVYSVRGDFRDYLIGKKLFPSSKMRFSGWLGFAARRLKILNCVLIYFKIKPVNRYQLWLDLCKLDGAKWRELYKPIQNQPNHSPRVLLHRGAQWRSKVYPFTEPLAEMLGDNQIPVVLGYGPGDPPPESRQPTCLLQTDNILSELQKYSLVVTNDSAPMHLAAFLRCRVLSIANVANLQEWLPPQVDCLVSASMPLGYRPKPAYLTDTEISDWPPVEIVFNKIFQIMNVTPHDQSGSTNHLNY